MANKPTQPVFPLGLAAEKQSTLAGVLNTGTIEHGPDAVLTLPEGNASAGLPSSVRYNADSDEFEGFYENGGWLPLGGGGIRWEVLPHASTATLTEGRGYLINNTTGASTVVLPSPTRIGDSVTICDAYGKFATYPLTVSPSGNNLYGSTEDMAITTDNVSATFTWSGPEQGWIITSGVGLGQGRVYSREIFTKILASETSSVALNTPPTIVDVYADGKRLAESKYSLDGNVITFSPSLPANTELQVIEYTPIQLGNGGGSSSSTITWVYNGGSAIGGETEITLDVVVDDVPAIDINGSRQYKNLGFTFDPLTSKISLAQELEPEDEVVVIINGTPNIYNQIDYTLREVARVTNVKDTEVVYFSVGAVLSGYKVIYDKETQRAYPLPADIAPGTTAVSLSSSAVLVHSAGSVDLGELAVSREEYVTLSGSFDTGVTVNTKNELVVFTDGKYRWDGELPKEVSAGSTPETAGGVGAGKWLSVGDTALRSEVYSNMAWVSPEMYGALKVESDADTQAVIDAFTTAKTMGLAVKLSRIYKCDQNISVTNFYGDVFGVSMATCGIKFAAGYGLVIDNSGTTVVRKPVGLRNFTIKATGQLQGTALTFLGTGGVAYARQLIVRDLDVSNDAGTQSSFDTVFKLSRAGQCVFDGVNVTGGGTSVPVYRMGKIFDLHSTKNINIVNGSYQNFDTFMYAHDDTEGVVVFGNHIIAGRRGVVSENNVGNLFQVTNNHFNTSLSAVELGDLSNNGGNHSIITDNFCMVWNGIPEDDTTPYIGFKSCAMYGTYSDNEVLLTGFTKDVTHTLFTSNATGTRTAQQNIVSNPRVNNCTRGIRMLAGTQSNHVSNVQRVGVTLANAIIDEGANNRSWMFDVDSNTFMTRNIKLCTPGSAVAQQIRFYSSTDANTPSAILRVSGGVAGVGGDGTAELTAGTSVFKNIRPSAANTYSCGASGAPWAGGFTQTAFTVTSDADYKSDPLLMTDDILDAAEEVQLVQYQYLDRIEEKGADGARWHFGAIAQRYVEAFERHGLDAHRFGFICYDEWGDAPAVVDDETGEVVTPAIKAGSRYGIRYEEMLVMEAAVQRRRVRRLEERVAALEAKLL